MYVVLAAYIVAPFCLRHIAHHSKMFPDSWEWEREKKD